jgi:hypothetical protein
MRKTNLKGPWYATQPEECAGWWVVSTDPEGNDSVDESGDGGFEKETAHLIAAAPELYEALKLLVSYGNVFAHKSGQASPYEMAQTALAKARGKP